MRIYVTGTPECPPSAEEWQAWMSLSYRAVLAPIHILDLYLSIPSTKVK